MARKGENIFKRKDGRWEARYIKEREPSGKIVYGFCYGKTYREAKEKAQTAKGLLIRSIGLTPVRDRTLFSAYCREWLALQRNRVKESTYVKYLTICEKHILPELGGCTMSQITTQCVDLFKCMLMNTKNLSPKTTRDILGVLRSVTVYVSRQHPDVHPQIDFSYPKNVKQEMRVLSNEEQQRFICFLMEDMDACKFGILLALLTGIRIGELCALRWNNVSKEEKTIRITATMQRLRDLSETRTAKTKIQIKSPKSDTSIRTIPVSDNTAALCERMRPSSPNAFILTGSEEYMEPRTLQYRFQKYTMECGIENVHFHTLRHTFATRCVEVNFELKCLSEILGHASTSITLDRYVHSSIALKRENINKLEAVGLG